MAALSLIEVVVPTAGWQRRAARIYMWNDDVTGRDVQPFSLHLVEEEVDLCPQENTNKKEIL